MKQQSTNKLKGLSLFANVGIAETYLADIGVDIVIANEIEPQRAKFYQHLYPQCDMIVGDITSENIFNEIIEKSKKEQVDFLIATPPCQGMSTVGKKDEFDPRNSLIYYAVQAIKAIKPKYVLLENVPEQLLTRIKINNNLLLIPDYLQEELANQYNFANEVLIDAADYGVPQTRQRAIFLLTRKDLNFTWQMPSKLEPKITMLDAIGHLPPLDPLVKDIDAIKLLELFPKYKEREEKALAISKWHKPPTHIFRQVYALMHTPTGQTAFDNPDQFKPKKNNGDFVRGFKNTYKRQAWDKPAFTITMYNRTIGSQNNVHPGRYYGKDENGYALYSDARVLTIYEIMILMTLPTNWDIPQWASEHFVRSVIGEGIPPMLVKNIMLQLLKQI